MKRVVCARPHDPRRLHRLLHAKFLQGKHAARAAGDHVSRSRHERSNLKTNAELVRARLRVGTHPTSGGGRWGMTRWRSVHCFVIVCGIET